MSRISLNDREFWESVVPKSKFLKNYPRKSGKIVDILPINVAKPIKFAAL